MASMSSEGLKSISYLGGSPQSLADLADKGNTTSVEVSQSSIAAAAEKYESEHSPKKQKLSEVHVMTGEEEERKVIQERINF